MPLDDIVNLQITIEPSASERPNFGRILILPTTAPFAPRTKLYSSLTEMTDDGFQTTDQAYLDAAGVFSQNPRPSDVMVGRRDAAVAMVRTLRFTGSADGTYTVQINGEDYTHVAAGQTATQIRDAVKALIDAGVVPVTTANDGTDGLKITSDTAGIQFVTSLTSPLGTLKFEQDVNITGNTAGLYRIQIGASKADYTADGIVLAAVIRDGLVTAVNALTGTTGVDASPGTGDNLKLRSTSDFVATVSGPGGPDIVLNGAGEWVANVGIPEALDLIDIDNEDWYGLVIEERSDDYIESACRAVETRRKIFGAQSSDATIPDGGVYDPGEINTDIASRLLGLGFTRTFVSYHADDTEPLSASWMGRIFATDPASNTWKFKTLVGITAQEFTSTQLANMISKNANHYAVKGSKKITKEGVMANGEYIDNIRGIDELFANIQLGVFDVFVKTAKVPFTQGGIEQLGGAVSGAIKQSVGRLIADSRTLADGTVERPAFSVTTPAINDIPVADRQARRIPSTNPISFEATLAGAIHEVNIRGTVSV